MNNTKFSQDYNKLINEYKKLHSNGIGKLSSKDTFAGTSLSNWVLTIRKILSENFCRSIIDFGCGKAGLYQREITLDGVVYSDLSHFWNCNKIYLYDPAVEEYSKYPSEKADAVICTDVLEHIPPQDIEIFIESLYRLASKILFIVVSTRPASKFFENGQNIHLTIKTEENWKEIFNRFGEEFKSIKTFIHFN